MPALQDLVHIVPVETAGVEAGALIGHGDALLVEAHIQPALGIALLGGGEPAAVDLDQLHQTAEPGIPHILVLDEHRRFFHLIILYPGIKYISKLFLIDGSLFKINSLRLLR